jgi:hypothetical protein
MDDWPFPDPPNDMSITTRQIVEGGMPILLVCHEADDGSWLFLTGGSFDVTDGMLVTLRNMVERDSSLIELADLPLGWQAWRERRGSPWERGPADSPQDQ